MKISSTLILLALLLNGCYQKQPELDKGGKYCTVSGHIDGCGILSEMGISFWEDSIYHYIPLYVHSGKFSVKVPFKEPHPATIYYNSVWKSPKLRGHSSISIFLDSSFIFIQGRADSLQNSTIKGGINQCLWDTVQKAKVRIGSESQMVVDAIMNGHFKSRIEEARQKKDTLLAESLIQKMMDSINNLHLGSASMAYNFAKNHPSSPVSAYVLFYTTGKYNSSECIALYYSLDSSIQNLKAAIKFRSQNINLKNIELGKVAPDFSFKDQTAKEIRLSAFKNKALLLTFWTYYCTPCREENRKLSRTYQKYHKDGLEIISVYSGKADSKWYDAMKKDSIVWVSTTDAEHSKGPIFSHYGIYATPYMVLMDENRIIRARGNYIFGLEDSIKRLLW